MAVAVLISFVLRGVVELVESNTNDRLVEVEGAGALAAMESEDIWRGPVSKVANKAENRLSKSSGKP